MPVDEVRVRLADPNDEARVAAMARALSRDARVRRFMGGIRAEGASDELVRETRGGPDEIALVAEVGPALVGEAYAARIGARSAEAAFVVAEGQRHRGVGTRLFSAMVNELRARGITSMRIETFADNREMLSLISESGLPARLHHVDGTIVATLQLGSSSDGESRCES